jgi:energy-converting hydrogenase Eha subunit H
VATWLRNLINEIGFIILIISSSIPMTVDNQEIIAIIKIDALNRRTKYINIRYYHFREYTKQDIIDPYYIPTSKILTNGFIKTLDRLKFTTFVTFIGMQN